MKINMGTEILDLTGEPIKVGEENLTLRIVLTGALSDLPDGEKPDGARSVKKLNLALRIMNEDAIEFSVDESSELMGLVGKMYKPLVAGRVWHILDPTKRE